MALNDSALRALKPGEKRYVRSDGDGLAIEIYPSGGMAWRYRYQWNGKTEKVCLGQYPAVTLKQARRLRKEAAALVKSGQSPAQAKQAGKVSVRTEAAKPAVLTLRAFSDQYLADLDAKGRDTSSIRRALDKDILPALGDRPLNGLTADDLALVVARKAETHPAAAGAIRGILKRLFDLAVLRDQVPKNPVLPVPSIPTVARDRALSESELRKFLAALASSDTDQALKIALRLILMTLARKAELAQATWDEVDFDEAVWRIPAARTKNGKPHSVYLAPQAVALFQELQRLAPSSPWILPDRSGSASRAHNALNRALERLIAGTGIHPFTIHDLRRTGATALHEAGFQSDVIEKALNHTLPGVRGVYNRASYAAQRRDMLAFWAIYLEGLPSAAGNVVLRRFAASPADR